MAIDFPPSPTVGERYTFGASTWEWNGTVWNNVSSTVGPAGAQGIQGIQGLQGIDGIQGIQGSGIQGLQGIQGTTAGGNFTYGAMPPATAGAGDRWVDSATGILWTYIDDGTSTQWVQL